MGGGRVDDHAEDTGCEGEAGHGEQVGQGLDVGRPASQAGRDRVGTEVGAGRGLGAVEVGEEGAGGRDRVLGGVEHDGREVEEDAVEQRRQVGVGCHAQPQ